jgi:DNA-binding transcriptional regulator GbsR (MarR family)
MVNDEIKQELINAYSQAYQNMGYSSLMGKIVALLLISPKPLSLDEISEQLLMSKGPVSQIARKLKDHHLIEKVWIPGERKDFYKAADDIFGQAFANYTSSMKRNLMIAETFGERVSDLNAKDEESQHFAKRMHEMKVFYSKMIEYNRKFLEDWRESIKPEISYEKVS